MDSISCYFEIASDLSSRFAGIVPERVDEEIWHALRRISDLFSADASAIYESSANQDGLTPVQAINMDGRPSLSSMLGGQTPAPQVFMDVLRRKQSFRLRVPEDLPAVAEKDRAWLAQCGIKSLLLVPISAQPPIDYLFLLASVHSSRAWSRKDVTQVKLLAEILAAAKSQNRLQRSLQHAKQDLSQLQRKCSVGRWEWEVVSGRIVRMEMVDQILGIRPATQEHFMQFVSESDRQMLQAEIDDALHGNGGMPEIEYGIRTCRGDLRLIHSEFEVVADATGVRIIGSFQDVTNARSTQRELALLRLQCWHADRVAQTGVLVASLAHELSQPLAAILGNAQAGLRLLSQEPLNKKEIYDLLQDIVQDNHQARHIIDALRAMIRKKGTDQIVIDAGHIVREVMVLLHRELLVQKVEANLECEDQCIVYADKVQIQQVVLNMILNSIDAMRGCPADRRRILLKVKRAVSPAGDEEVQVSVRDTGPGIPIDQVANVFEAFWTTKPDGLGLGLAVCRSIIEVHGGRIWVESNSMPGVTFHFSLPLARS